MNAQQPHTHAAAQEFFDAIADDYTRRSRTAVWNVSSLSFSRRQDLVIKMMSQTPTGGTVLDYGMGPAVFGPPAVEQGLRYVGIDISPRMVHVAQQMQLPNAEFHVGDLNLLDQFAGSADTVLLIGLIDYLEFPQEGLRKLARCVKPGGRLVLSFRNHRSVPRFLRNTAKRLWRTIRPSRPEVETAFEAPVLENSFVPRRDLAPVLESEGFRKVDVEYLDCSPVFFNLPLPRAVWKLWKRVDEAVSSRPMSWMCASGVLVASGKR